MPNTIYPIRLYGDPVLRARARPVADLGAPVKVPGFAPRPLQQLARDLLETMYEARGVGLAAPQVGLPLRLFVAAEYEDDEDEGPERPLRSRVLREIIAINPVLEVTDRRKDTSYEEGCLSIPRIYEKGVPRARAVRLRYTDLDGVERIEEVDDYLARVFQHEHDHLSGTLFLDYLPDSVTETHRKALGEMQREAKSYLKALQAPGHR